MGYDNTNSGILWANDRKEKPEHSDMSGKLFVGDVEHYFDGWRDAKVILLKFRRKGTQGDNIGKGELKRTDKEGKSEKYPDWKGKIKTASGEEFQISGWRRAPEGKKPFLSVKIEKPYQGGGSQSSGSQSSGGQSSQSAQEEAGDAMF